MSKKPFAFWNDQDLCDWFDGLSEDYIRSLIDLHDDHDITPRKAFHYVFGDLDSQRCTCQACRLSLSPVPAHKSQSESVAAPAEVGQGQGTITLEQFQRWLENKAHAARAEYFKGPQGETLSQEIERCRPFTDFIERARIATKLLMQFKLEQGA